MSPPKRAKGFEPSTFSVGNAGPWLCLCEKIPCGAPIEVMHSEACTVCARCFVQRIYGRAWFDEPGGAMAMARAKEAQHGEGWAWQGLLVLRDCALCAYAFGVVFLTTQLRLLVAAHHPIAKYQAPMIACDGV